MVKDIMIKATECFIKTREAPHDLCTNKRFLYMIYKCTKWTNYPSGLANGQGTLIVMNWQNNSSGIYCRQIFTPAGGSTKIFQRTISGTPSNLTVNPWTNIADGGNADTFAENSIDKLFK